MQLLRNKLRPRLLFSPSTLIEQMERANAEFRRAGDGTVFAWPFGRMPVRNAIDSVTRVSSRVEFIEVEFNGIGVRSPYIEHQGIRIGCCKQIARSPDSTLASRSVINSSRPTRVRNRSI
jgi:hypothetical protein